MMIFIAPLSHKKKWNIISSAYEHEAAGPHGPRCARLACRWRSLLIWQTTMHHDTVSAKLAHRYSRADEAPCMYHDLLLHLSHSDWRSVEDGAEAKPAGISAACVVSCIST